MRNLHILHDEKIINRAISNFEEVFPGENRYIVLANLNSEMKHVDSSLCPNIFYLKFNSDEFWKTIGDIKQYKYVIIHFLCSTSAEFINAINHPQICWIEWGADLYNNFLQAKGLSLYRDERLVYKIKEKYLPWFVTKWLIRLKLLKKLTIYKEAVKKVKYFIPDSMEDEYYLFLKYYPEYSHLEYRNFFYYPIDQMLGDDLINSRVSGSNIFVGNSASMTNNHPYILSLLKDKQITNKIIVPLSYGGPKDYVKEVVAIGEKLISDRFCPILDYMTLREYNKLFLSANSFIYASIRQEAVGNILMALYLGAKVFLDKDNPLFSFYKRMGFIIYSIDEISYDSINAKMLESDYIKNRELVLSLYSRRSLLSTIKNTFK